MKRHHATADAESHPAAAGGLGRPPGAKVLADQRHGGRAEGRTRQVAQRLPAQGDPVGPLAAFAQPVDDAQKPKLTDHHRQAVNARRHADAQQSRINLLTSATGSCGCRRNPARPSSQTASTARPAEAMAHCRPSGDPLKTKTRQRSDSQEEAQASGKLTTATPPSTHKPVRVSPAPTRQAMPADSTTWKTSSRNKGRR